MGLTLKLIMLMAVATTVSVAATVGLRPVPGDDLLILSALVVGWTAVVGGAGVVMVGRPLRSLVAKAHRIGGGELGGPLPVNGSDEFAILARALNTLCAQLGTALAERDAAATTHVAAVERLRHVDRLSTMGSLAAGIAHELGTPLHVVGGRAQLILDAPTASEACKKAALVIVEETDRMARIVRQLLGFARKHPPERVTLDARALSARVVDLLSMLARKSGVTLHLGRPSSGNAQVFADGGQLEQAVTNLVVNAVQASRFGQTVRLDVRRIDAVAPPPEVGGADRDEVWLSVTDEGPGIPDGHFEKLFTPFFTTKDVGAGTGLGLAIAWGLVREHDGAILVDTRAGAGSTFTIRLPASDAAPATARARPHGVAS